MLKSLPSTVTALVLSAPITTEVDAVSVDAVSVDTFLTIVKVWTSDELLFCYKYLSHTLGQTISETNTMSRAQL